jgi:Mg-chelatase subunit ChlD
MSTFFIDQQAEAEKQHALKRKRVGALANVFSKTLSVLTKHKISVNVVDRKEINAPAFSSTKEVWLNVAHIKDDFTPNAIASYNGLAFHELAHLRFTPRNGSRLVQLIKEEQQQNELWEAFNCLEDSRIELLLTGWLPSTKAWLVATMCDYLLADEEAISRAFPLVYGRKYLPIELRQLASDNFVKPELQDELANVIDQYISLTFVGNENVEVGFNLIKKFAELLSELPALPQSPQSGEGEGTTITVRIKSPNGHEGRPTQGYESSSVRPATKEEQERAKKNAQKNVVEVVIDTTPKEEKSDLTKDESALTKSDTPTQSQPTQSQPKDNSFDDDFDFEFDDFDSDDDEPTTPKEEGGKGVGTTGGETGTNQQVTDILNDILSDVVKEVSKGINDIAKQLGVDTELVGGNAKTPDKAIYKEVRIPEELSFLSKKFGVELERLQADFDPAWLNGERSGKLNAGRYLRGEQLDTVFDEWSEGRDDVVSIEAVILLDSSGSMSGRNADNAYKSMWAIKKALERVEARTTVVTFDTYTHLLYGADEKAGTTIRDAGAQYGTSPEDGLLYAKRVLANSDKAIKILFMITDGQWNTTDGEKAVNEMRSAGVLTCQALISGYSHTEDELNNYRHSFELMTSMQSAKDILILGKDLVRLAIKRNLVA